VRKKHETSCCSRSPVSEIHLSLGVRNSSVGECGPTLNGITVSLPICPRSGRWQIPLTAKPTRRENLAETRPGVERPTRSVLVVYGRSLYINRARKGCICILVSRNEHASLVRVNRISLILHNFSRYYQLSTRRRRAGRSAAARGMDAADRYRPGRLYNH